MFCVDACIKAARRTVVY